MARSWLGGELAGEETCDVQYSHQQGCSEVYSETISRQTFANADDFLQSRLHAQNLFQQQNK